MREIEAEEIKAKRRLELMVTDIFRDAEKQQQQTVKTKADFSISLPQLYALLAIIGVSVMTSTATVLVIGYSLLHHHLLNLLN